MYFKGFSFENLENIIENDTITVRFFKRSTWAKDFVDLIDTAILRYNGVHNRPFSRTKIMYDQEKPRGKNRDKEMGL